MTQPSRPTPLWRSIADALSDDLAQKRYRPGDKLPTEAALSDRFGVNRHTVRQAIATLIDEGQLRSRRGAGTFVVAMQTDYPIGRRVRFRRSFEAAGKVPDKRILHMETRAGTVAECAALGLPPGAEIHFAEGLSLADDAPVAHFHSAFPGWLGPDFPGHLRDMSSVTEALRACGVADYTRASTRLTAVSATAAQAVLLHLREGMPLLRSEAVNHATDGRPVEFGITVFAGDRVALTISP